MGLSPEVTAAIRLNFVSKDSDNVIKGSIIPIDDGQTVALGDSSRKFSALYVKRLYADSVVSQGTSMDMVDGLHASSTPRPGWLLALNGSGAFPTSAYPEAVLKSGITQNLPVADGVTIDGVDLSVLQNQVYQLSSKPVQMQTHDFLGSYHSISGVSAGMVLRGTGTNKVAFGVLQDGDIPASIVRTSRSVIAGQGLQGGGALADNVVLSVNTGTGLVISNGKVQATDPEQITADSENAWVGGKHTHKVAASSAPTGAALLKSDSTGGIVLRRLAVGDQQVTGDGQIAADYIYATDAVIDRELSVSLHTFDVNRYGARVNSAKDLGYGFVVLPCWKKQPIMLLKELAGQEGDVLHIKDSNDGLLFRIDAAGNIDAGPVGHVVGESGWRVSAKGDAEFETITTRGQFKSVLFATNEMHALGGTLAVLPSGQVAAPIDSADNVIASTFDLVVKAMPDGSCPFELNDVLRTAFRSKSKRQ